MQHIKKTGIKGADYSYMQLGSKLSYEHASEESSHKHCKQQMCEACRLALLAPMPAAAMLYTLLATSCTSCRKIFWA